VIKKNGTFGQKGTAPKGGTLGEICASAMDGQLEIVSMIVEPRTRIPQLKLGGYVKELELLSSKLKSQSAKKFLVNLPKTSLVLIH
jgi:hypothetical protein